MLPLTWITRIWHSLTLTSDWMAWNLFLALIPLVLSLWLFRLAKTRSIFWWVGVLAFIAFLPNAPYVVTDFIHLRWELRQTSSLLFNTLVVVPKYMLFALVGFEAYVLSLINLGHYLKRQGLGNYIFQAELVLHGLSAIGVYLGRFERFNSWDLVTQLTDLVHSVTENLLDERPLMFITAGFILIAGLYWALKQVSLAVLAWAGNSDRRPI